MSNTPLPVNSHNRNGDGSQLLMEGKSRQQSSYGHENGDNEYPEETQTIATRKETEDKARMMKPSFNYDLSIFLAFQEYLNTKNHQGLALIARQKGIPPFLRFKAWPILLMHHPMVLNPFIKPDYDTPLRGDNGNNENDDLPNYYLEEEMSIRKDIQKYFDRCRPNGSSTLSREESQIFDIILHAVHKFIKKWGQIVKYDNALTWIALGLAEWVPPIPHTPWVLVGRDCNTVQDSCIKNLFDDYSIYIGNFEGLDKYLEDITKEDRISTMSFLDIYERLLLVLLHSPEEKFKYEVEKTPTKINKKILPINGGTLEERVSFFIYCFRKLLPDLANFFQEEQILNKFGSHDDEWLIWWLKYGGSKVWSHLDRGRIWDLMFGWRLQNMKKPMSYYIEKLHMTKGFSEKMGPDIFWSVGESDCPSPNHKRTSSFKELIHELHINDGMNNLLSLVHDSSVLNSLLESPSNELRSSRSSSLSTISLANEVSIPFSKMDPHVELVFIALALLKSKENTLVELDQHEIRQYLSRLPTTSVNVRAKYPQVRLEDSKANSGIVSNDFADSHKIDFIDNILNEAGELWRKWLWIEMTEDD